MTVIVYKTSNPFICTILSESIIFPNRSLNKVILDNIPNRIVSIIFFLTDYFYFKINLRGLRVCTPSAQNVNIIKLNLSKSF